MPFAPFYNSWKKIKKVFLQFQGVQKDTSGMKRVKAVVKDMFKLNKFCNKNRTAWSICLFLNTGQYLGVIVIWNPSLSHSCTHLCPNPFPMHPFSIPWKHQKTVRFSDVFRGWRKGALGTNGLNCVVNQIFGHKKYNHHSLFWNLFSGVTEM